MKSCFINNSTSNSKLILIFAGWNSTPELYRNCTMPGWDLLVVYDYDDFDFNTSILSGYSTIYVYAWSLGVAVANCVLNNIKVEAAYAINGTTLPIDDNYGIPEAIFSGTAENLNERNLTKFRLRMVAGMKELQTLSPYLNDTDPESIKKLQNQLYTFINHDFTLNSNLRWTKVFIGKNDRIFPAESQINAWEKHHSKPEMVISDNPHFIPLEKIIHSTIHDICRLGNRFRSAHKTYNDNATAQHIISDHLTSHILKHLKSNNLSFPNKIIELGVGTGTFSNLYAPILKPLKVTYIDLYEIDTLNLIDDETYLTTDAEEYIHHLAQQPTQNKADAILSASTIQWFVNLPEFFNNAAKVIDIDGVLACSTFLPGNLYQLDKVRPTPMKYHTIEELHEMASAEFENVEIYEEDINLDFPNAKEALQHLIKTGVGGATTTRPESILKLSKALQPDPSRPATLTYKAAYIICSKPTKPSSASEQL